MNYIVRTKTLVITHYSSHITRHTLLGIQAPANALVMSKLMLNIRFELFKALLAGFQKSRTYFIAINSIGNFPGYTQSRRLNLTLSAVTVNCI